MNKGRIVDILLIITLVLVAFGITYTLLTLNRGQTRPPPEPRVETPVETPVPTDPADRPVVPEGLPTQPQDDGELPVIGGPATPVEQPDETPVQVEPDEEETTPQPPRTLAAGEVQLEGVGFSFVTGGAGACGVVLEPWVHVAVSRDLLADLGCGAQVRVELAEETGGNRIVNATIGDTMNPSHSLTVNIYVGQDEPALEYGRTTGILSAP